jgi:hypothetical protein
MEDVVLPPTSRSVSEFERALKGVVVRYERDNEPVKYDQVRGISSTNSSSCLKFFGNIGVLEIEKQGTYIPTSSAIDLFSDDRETQNSGLQGLHDILSDSDLFDEISFIVENYDFTLEEIADELVVDIESDDESDDEDIADGIELFIKIFENLGLFEIDEDGRVQMVSIDEEVNTESDDSPSMEQVSDGSGAEQAGQNSVNHKPPNSAESSLSVTELDVEVTVPPARTDPGKLHRICSVIKDAGEVSVDDLESDEELDLSEQYIQHSLEYGEVLGFIKELPDGDGYELTEPGYDLGYRTDISETSELFREGLLNSPEFRSVISELIGDASVKNDGYIAMETALRIYRAKFGLTDAGEDRLERGVRTLFKTLEMAGYGEYKRGGSEHPTRLQLSSIDTLQQDIQPDPSTGDEEVEPEVDSGMPDSEDEAADNQEIASEQTENLSDDSKDSEPVPEQVRQTDQEAHDTTGTHREAVVNLDIELDLSEIDTNELEQKLSAIDEFIEGSDYNT